MLYANDNKRKIRDLKKAKTLTILSIDIDVAILNGRCQKKKVKKRSKKKRILFRIREDGELNLFFKNYFYLFGTERGCKHFL